MPGYVRAEIPRWKKQANRRVLRSDAAKAHLDIEFLEKFCLQSASTADVSAITGRFSFLRKFIVSHVNLEHERDVEDMEAQLSELLKEMGSFRGQLSKLNSKVFKASDPRPGKMTKAGAKICFRCKSEDHDVKRCTEARKRKAASTGEVLEVRTDETPIPVEFVLEVVPTETTSVVPTSISVQQFNPDPIPIQEEPATAQLEHSTPDRVEWAAKAKSRNRRKRRGESGCLPTSFDVPRSSQRLSAVEVKHSTPIQVELPMEAAAAVPRSELKYSGPDSNLKYPDRVMCQFPECGRLHLRNEYPRVWCWTCQFAPDYGAGGMVPDRGWGSLPRWFWSTESQEEWCWYTGQKGKPTLVQFEPRGRPTQ